ncbi:MAG: tRNA (uridine(34)/cytosine(34)/5-carboxymethylaminomethyluridine(34)-2'-O)-methyltransferase TrmL [Spirochaetales bacterium]|nr:tRNA (uridine(34)/cytosine(34)/5-carboxymethylaminomethyluridine(34)-2'-O)-methyltransferase TrmL [Spirochaetales bacterium]
MPLHIVLVEPEIPQNTGNIARTCAATGAELHLIHPLGFSTEDRHLKRAGLDYWDLLHVHHHNNFHTFLSQHPHAQMVFVTTKALKTYTEMKYQEDSWLIFGKETAGIPEEILVQYPESCVRIPMIEDSRSLNLSNAVAIVVYEALRQLNFLHLKAQGSLHRLSWDK